MAGTQCAETCLEASAGPCGGRHMDCILSAVGATAGLWQEALCRDLAIVFFFHFLSGFSREKYKYIRAPILFSAMETPASRKDRGSVSRTLTTAAF